ncbi:hypothetical protein ACVXZ4_14260 [Lacisediminihabitans sp. FW035]
MAEISDTFIVELQYDEVVVLFALLHRLEDQSALENISQDRAELIALQSLTSALEPLINEVFSPNFAEFIVAAKERLTGLDE